MERTDSELVEGLAGLAEGLEADGYTLDARWLDNGSVEVKVGATPEACEDCLVPRDLMAVLAASMLADNGIAIEEEQVVVVYPEGSAAH